MQSVVILTGNLTVSNTLYIIHATGGIWVIIYTLLNGTIFQRMAKQALQYYTV